MPSFDLAALLNLSLQVPGHVQVLEGFKTELGGGDDDWDETDDYQRICKFQGLRRSPFKKTLLQEDKEGTANEETMGSSTTKSAEENILKQLSAPSGGTGADAEVEIKVNQVQGLQGLGHSYQGCEV